MSTPTAPLHLSEGITTGLLEFRSHAAAPVLMIVPALGVTARAYQRLGTALSDAGFNTLVLDLRGVGTSSLRARRGIDWGYLDVVDMELRRLWDEAEQRFPGAGKIWLGHSMGGHLALLHQARHADQPVGHIALVASGTPWYRSYSLIGGPLVYIFAALVAWSSRVLGVFRGDWFQFGGPQGATLMREWAGFSRTGELGALGREAWPAMPALHDCERSIYAVSMHGDHFAPPATTTHLASLIRGEVNMDRLAALDDGQRPGHFGWLKQPASVVTLLADHYGKSDG